MARRRRSLFGGGKRKYKRHNPFAFKLKQQTIYTVGAIWLWLFAGIIIARFASGFLRAIGFTLLVLFVATYIYAAYGRKDKS